MRHTVLGAVFALSAFAVLSFGCGSGAPPAANSFTKIYTETIQPRCSSDFCHYNGVDIRFGALDMSSKVRAYWSLVGTPCMGSNCSQSGMRVVPGQPDSSVMYLKLSAPTPCGIQMPMDRTNYSTNGTSQLTFSESPLSADDDEQQHIRDWIQDGAQDN